LPGGVYLLWSGSFSQLSSKLAISFIWKAHFSWGLVFLMALSVTPWFWISSVDDFEANVIDHHPRENEVTNSISFCLAYALMSSYISSPFFSVSFFSSPSWHLSYRGWEIQSQALRESGLHKKILRLESFIIFPSKEWH
jgi:hypothetical protein